MNLMSDFYRNRIVSYKNISLILISLAFILSGCSLSKPYVGLEVDTSRWKQYQEGVTYFIYTNHLEIQIKISETDNQNEYMMVGTIDAANRSLKSFDRFVVEDCNFRIVLAKNNLIIDSLAFFPKGEDINNKLPFKRTFTTDAFDSFTVTYQISVRG